MNIKDRISEIKRKYVFSENQEFSSLISGKLTSPAFIEMDDSGMIYLLEIPEIKVMKFSPSGEKIWEVEYEKLTSSNGIRGFQYENGILYLLDIHKNAVVKMDADGKILGTYGLPMSKAVYVQYIPPCQEYHVTDFDLARPSDSNRVIRLNKDLKMIEDYRIDKNLLKKNRITMLRHFPGMNKLCVRFMDNDNQNVSLHLFSLSGEYEKEFWNSESASLIKSYIETPYGIFLVDNSGNITKLDGEGKFVWSKKYEKTIFTSLAYHKEHLFVIDRTNCTLRKIGIARL